MGSITSFLGSSEKKHQQLKRG